MVKNIICVLVSIWLCLFCLYIREKRTSCGVKNGSISITEEGIGIKTDKREEGKTLGEIEHSGKEVENTESSYGIGETREDVEKSKGNVKNERGQNDKWKITSYYTPVKGQLSYYNDRTYEQDFNMNCSGDCFVTASGYKLSSKDKMKVLACPTPLDIGTKIRIKTEVGEEFTGTCYDRGGGIKGNKIDIWVGHGEEGKHWYQSVNIKTYYNTSIFIIK